MHSTLVRVQNVFGFFTTVAFVLAAFTALSVVLSPQTPSATVELRNMQVVKGRPHYYSSKKEEYAIIKFDLEADFSSLFNWNTKQLFIYILASYPSLIPNAPPSQVIIWDLIIPSPSQQNPLSPWSFFAQRANRIDSPSSRSKSSKSAKISPPKQPLGYSSAGQPGMLSLKNTKPKYQITDISGTLAERENVTLEVGWNVQPWVGALTWTMPDGNSWGRWNGVSGGRSRMFDLPALKGVKKAAETAVERGTPAGAAGVTAVVG